MIKKKILFIGGSSLLAVHWISLTKKKFDVHISINKKKVSFDGVKNVKFNYLSDDKIFLKLKRIKPNIVINLAGLTNIELCEKNIKLSNFVNIELPKKFSYFCNLLDIKFIHISTDHLFDGKKSFYTELSKVEPLNHYALSKYKGELAVIKSNKKSLIIRTNFFGIGTSYRESFSDFIICNLRNKNKIYLFDDVFFNPILISELVAKVGNLIKLDVSGIFNITSNERISKYNFGKKIAKIFNLEKGLIIKSSIKKSHLKVPRPKDMTLSNKKYKLLVKKNTFISLDKQIQKLKTQENHTIYKEIKKL